MKSIRRKKCSKYLSVFLVTCTMIAGSVSYTHLDVYKRQDADLAKNWTDLNSFTWRLNETGGGTNWQAGIKKGEDVLKTGSGTKKYVVFLTDGNPTFRYNESGKTVGEGNDDSQGYNYLSLIHIFAK